MGCTPIVLRPAALQLRYGRGNPGATIDTAVVVGLCKQTPPGAAFARNRGAKCVVVTVCASTTYLPLISFAFYSAHLMHANVFGFLRLKAIICDN